MRSASRDVVVTGLGAVCAVAHDQRALWEAIATGRDGVAPIRRFSTDGFRVHCGALVPAWSEPDDASDSDELCRRFALDAAREALRDAALEPPPIARQRLAFVFGTGLTGLEQPIHALAERLAHDLGLGGPCIT